MLKTGDQPPPTVKAIGNKRPAAEPDDDLEGERSRGGSSKKPKSTDAPKMLHCDPGASLSHISEGSANIGLRFKTRAMFDLQERDFSSFV